MNGLRTMVFRGCVMTEFGRRGAGRALTLGCCVGAVAVSAMSVRAQPVGDLEPLGIRTERWTIFPSLSLSAEYDDNVFAVPDDSALSTSDVLFVLSPTVTAEANTRRHAFSLSAGGDIGRYLDETDLNYNDFRVGADGRWDATQTFDVSASLAFDRTREDQADPDRSLADVARRETTNIDTIAGELSAEKRWRRTFTRASAGFNRRDFEALDATVGAGTVDLNADRDRWVFPLNWRVGYDVDRSVDVFVDVGYRLVRYDERSQIVTRNPDGTIDTVTEDDSQDFDTLSVRLGTDVDFDRLLDGDFAVGVERRFSDDPDVEDEFGFSFDADLDWIVTPRTTVTFTGQQGFEPAGGDDGDGSSLTTEIAVDLSYALSRQITLGTDLAYLRDDRTETDRTDDDVTAGVSAAYAVNRYAALSAAYRYRLRNSTDDDREFTRNSVLLSVTARY